MATKNTPTDSNINTNNNTNNVNVNVKVHQPKRAATKKKPEPNWYARTIIGGIIALVLSLCGYYLKNNMDKDKENVLTTEPVINPVEANH